MACSCCLTGQTPVRGQMRISLWDDESPTSFLFVFFWKCETKEAQTMGEIIPQ
jgi:hypothetical protein